MLQSLPCLARPHPAAPRRAAPRPAEMTALRSLPCLAMPGPARPCRARPGPATITPRAIDAHLCSSFPGALYAFHRAAPVHCSASVGLPVHFAMLLLGLSDLPPDPVPDLLLDVLPHRILRVMPAPRTVFGPCLASRRHAPPCRAVPCLARPRHAVYDPVRASIQTPCLALPRPAVPGRASPSPAAPRRAMPRPI